MSVSSSLALQAPVAPIRPHRPVARSHRVQVTDEPCTNLFQDAFSAEDTPVSLNRFELARARAQARIDRALDAVHQGDVADIKNLWQAAPQDSGFARYAVSNDDYAPLRATLYPAKPTTPCDEPETTASRDRLRLAVHAMNTTLTIAFPPIGVTVMTYTFLRGESMRLTARTMVLLGAVMTLMHSGLHLT